MRNILKYLIVVTLTIASTIGILELIVTLSPHYEVNHPHEISYYDDNDILIYNYHYESISEYTELKDIPSYFVNAVMLMEDQRFYKHHGIDYLGIIRSMLTNLKEGEIKQGGSTITQQLAKNLYLDNEKTLLRKLKEVFIARKLEKQLTKEEILELYLNSIYFGHNIYGIYQASYYYFDKLPTNLTLAESSLLAGLISSPNNYAPDINYELSIKRQKIVLNILSKKGYITNSEYNEAINENLIFNLTNKILDKNAHKYYLDYINQLLKEKSIINKQYDNIGYQIKTYFSKDISQIVLEAINSTIYDSFEEEVSVVIMEPNTGHVLTMIGGKNYQTSELNRATSSHFQIGSTIKPLLYYLALCSGMTPLSKFRSEETEFFIKGIGSYSPKNSNNKYGNRDITMLEAIALSDNIYAVKTTLLLGSSYIANFLSNFGISINEVNPTIGLGSIALTPLELCSIYNTLASGGVYYPPQLYSSISLTNGKLLFHYHNTPSFFLNKRVVNILSYLLLSPFDKGLTSYSTPSLVNYKTNNRFAAKTGTTSSSTWVVGYNPNYTICVWTGDDNNNEIKNSNLSKIIFQKIANDLTINDGDQFFSIPSFGTAFKLTNTQTGLTSNVYYTI